MIRRSLTMSFLALGSAVLMAGCGGGGGSTPVPAGSVRSVTGQVLAPASVAGRAADPDVPVAAASVTLTDITNGLPGTVVFTTRTDAAGHYAFTGLVADHIYLVVVTKQVTDSQGHSHTISMSGVAPAPDSTGHASEDITPGTTVGVGYILSQYEQFKSGAITAAQALGNIFRAAQDIANETDAARHDGTGSDIDLTKPADDPKSHGDDADKVSGKALRSAVFVASDGNAKGTAVDMLFDKTTNQAFLTLFVRDNAGDIFDADSFVGLVDAKGNFSGKTVDGTYNITGNVTPGQASGTWAAVDGSAKGGWKGDRPGDNANGAAGYRGVFRGPQNDEKGSWMMFVDKKGAVLIYGRSNKSDHIHVKNTIVMTGTLDSASAIAAKLSFPAEGGTLSGSDPTKGTMVVTGNTKVSGFYGSVHGTVTGSTSGSAVTGTWTIAGSDGANVFDETGTWTGVKY